jgi:hypothetical protein
MMELTTVNSGQWKPGQSRNLNGRPVGSRHQFSDAILRDLAEVWPAEDRDTMLHSAKAQPATFFAVCARLIPSDVKLAVERAYGGLSPEDHAMLRAIREAIPDANNQSPQAVLEYVSDGCSSQADRLAVKCTIWAASMSTRCRSLASAMAA